MLLLCAAFLIQAEPAPVLHPEAARAWLEERRVEQGFPGAQFAWAGASAARSGAIAVGVRERGGQDPLLAGDRMLWGSVGKTFVAAVALQMVEEGQFSLDDLVSKHLGDRDWYARLPNAAAITLRQLMMHTSGIPDHVRKPEVWQAVKTDPDRVWKTEELLAFALGDEPLCAAGERFEYADTNYVLLGAVIEKIGGAPLFDQVRARLLVPLELKDAAPSDRRVLPGLVQGHPVMLAEEWMIPARTIADGKFFMNPQFEHGGGGMYGAPAALAHWTWLLQAGTVLKPESRAARLQGGAVAPGAQEQYGLGVQIWPSSLGPAAGHGGWYPGYRTETAWFKDLDLAACVVINTDAPREVRNLRALLIGCLQRLRDGA
jgi:D-alanyl-D-alanine carboxypeptidase